MLRLPKITTRILWSWRESPKQLCFLQSIRLLSHGSLEATTKEKSIYEHLSRRSKEIRLLSLQPARFSDPVSVQLYKTDLDAIDGASVDDKPTWSCLSYSWRNFDRQKELIWVNEQPFLVTANLYRALQFMRRKAEARTLWAEQICTNKRDDDERSRQVKMMGDIFQFADSVFAWFGAEDWGTRAAFENDFSFI